MYMRHFYPLKRKEMLEFCFFYRNIALLQDDKCLLDFPFLHTPIIIILLLGLNRITHNIYYRSHKDNIDIIYLWAQRYRRSYKMRLKKRFLYLFLRYQLSLPLFFRTYKFHS